MKYTVNILFDRTGENVILLKKHRTEFAGRYNGCGGEIEEYEQSEECAIREINEETGLVFAPGELVEIGTLCLSGNIHDCKHTDEHAPVLVFYAGVIPAGQTVKASDEEPAAVFPVQSVLNQTVNSSLLAGNGDLLYFIHMGYKLCADRGLFDRKPDVTPVCTGVSLVTKNLDRGNPKLPKTYECKFQAGEGKQAHVHTHYVVSRNSLPRAFMDKTRCELTPDGVLAVIFSQTKDHILLLKQYRYAVGEYVYTLPGGLVDLGETPKDAILREIYEETGWNSDEWPLFDSVNSIKPLPPVFTDPSTMDQTVQCFVLRAAHPEVIPPLLKPGNPSLNEHIAPIWVDKAKAQQLLRPQLCSDIIPMTQLTQMVLYTWLCGADFWSFTP